jgi:nitrogen regulation protein NR(I)
MPRLLIADDEPAICFSIRQVFEDDDLSVLSAANAQEALRMVGDEQPDVVLLDVRLGGDDGLATFERLRELDPKCLVIFITGHGTSETAIAAMKRGAFDYLVKPLDADLLRQVVRQACEIRRLMKTPAIVERTDHDIDHPDLIIGSGPRMQSIFKQIGRVAAQDVNVLITGESGTGKELVARAIYHHSRRVDKPFLAINCAALAENLLESELFGHERGAFTGADRRRVGKFEQANGGTVFLDEVGDMASTTQAKILRLLQDGSFERVGGNEMLKTDVRIISATNRHLESLIQAGAFRLDLFHRLCGVNIALPSLCERREDIPELAHYFMFRMNRELGTSVASIAEETLDRLAAYRWPGNIRELQNVVRESLIHSAGPTLLPDFLPGHVGRAPSDAQPKPDTAVKAETPSWDTLARSVAGDFDQQRPGIYRRALETFDRILVGNALQRTGGHQAAAAELLGLSRPTLRAKLRQFIPLDEPSA